MQLYQKGLLVIDVSSMLSFLFLLCFALLLCYFIRLLRGVAVVEIRRVVYSGLDVLEITFSCALVLWIIGVVFPVIVHTNCFMQ